jgi:hypothetical protein
MRESRNIENVNADLAMMQAIHYWLNYSCKVSKVDLLVESSIRFPLMEYIERYLNADKCYLERKYEDFLSEDIFNTTKSVDIMWEKNKIEYIIELKYLSKDTNKEQERQRFFNDLVRLSLALKLKKDKERRCYFLICGDAVHFGEQMRGLIKQENGDNGGNLLENKDVDPEIDTEFSKWLVLNMREVPDTYAHVVYDKNNVNPRFKKFIKEYFEISEATEKNLRKPRKKDRIGNAKYLDSFYTKRVWLNYEKDEKMTGLWEVILTKE